MKTSSEIKSSDLIELHSLANERDYNEKRKYIHHAHSILSLYPNLLVLNIYIYLLRLKYYRIRDAYYTYVKFYNLAIIFLCVPQTYLRSFLFHYFSKYLVSFIFTRDPLRFRLANSQQRRVPHFCPPLKLLCETVITS